MQVIIDLLLRAKPMPHRITVQWETTPAEVEREVHRIANLLGAEIVGRREVRPVPRFLQQHQD